MNKIIINKDNLKENDITETKNKVKILLINSNNEILLAYSKNIYQFPGGTLEKYEKPLDALKREVKEETGINIPLKDTKHIASMNAYYKNFKKDGNNRKVIINYYELRKDLKINLYKTNYTEKEILGNFELRYIPLDELEKELIINKNIFKAKKGVENEMLKVIKLYKERKNVYS